MDAYPCETLLSSSKKSRISSRNGISTAKPILDSENFRVSPKTASYSLKSFITEESFSGGIRISTLSHGSSISIIAPASGNLWGEYISKIPFLEIYSPHKFPEAGEIIEIEEQWLKVEILMPPEKLSSVMKLLREYEAVLGETRKFSESRISLAVEMPLRELMRDFFDELKSSSQGYASMNYEFLENRPGDLLRLDLLVAEEIVPAFSKIVPRIKVEEEAFRSVEKLYKI